MGKRVISEYFCDVCGSVMRNSDLKSTVIHCYEEHKKGRDPELLDLHMTVHKISAEGEGTTKALAICYSCMLSALHKVAQNTGYNINIS